MSELNKEMVIAMVLNYEGFGRTHRGDVWAELLGIAQDRFAYYMCEKGLTIEELYEIKGVTYREPKRGRRMAETRERIEHILLRSGYVPYRLDLTSVPGQPAHRVFVEDQLLGRYFYKEDRLVLNNGEGYYLGALEDCETPLVHDRNGWSWHPEAKRAGFKARLK